MEKVLSEKEKNAIIAIAKEEWNKGAAEGEKWDDLSEEDREELLGHVQVAECKICKEFVIPSAIHKDSICTKCYAKLYPEEIRFVQQERLHCVVCGAKHKPLYNVIGVYFDGQMRNFLVCKDHVKKIKEFMTDKLRNIEKMKKKAEQDFVQVSKDEKEEPEVGTEFPKELVDNIAVDMANGESMHSEVEITPELGKIKEDDNGSEEKTPEFQS